MTKKCTQCGEIKAFDEYGKDKNKKDGLNSRCKSCAHIYNKQYRQDNKEKLAEKRKQYREANKEAIADYDKLRYQANKEAVAEKNKQYYQANKEAVIKGAKQYRQENKKLINSKKKQYYQDNKKVIIEYQIKYRQANKEKIAKRRRQYEKKRRANDPAYRMICSLRTGLYEAMNGNSKPKKTMELLGCSKEHLEHHLSAQFTDGMTLENYGEWQIDHIQAVSRFDHSDPEQVAICWHYTNMQPMWAKDNNRKSNKIISEHQVNLL